MHITIPEAGPRLANASGSLLDPDRQGNFLTLAWAYIRMMYVL